MENTMSLSIDWGYTSYQLQHKSDLINITEIEKQLNAKVAEVLFTELDWGDYFDVVEYVLGDTKQLKELRQLVNDVHGTDYYSIHDGKIGITV